MCAPGAPSDDRGQASLGGGLSLQVLAVQGRLRGDQRTEPVQPPLGQPFVASRPVKAGDDVDQGVLASGSPAGRSAKSAARRAPLRVAGQTMAASLLGKSF